MNNLRKIKILQKQVKMGYREGRNVMLPRGKRPDCALNQVKSK